MVGSSHYPRLPLKGAAVTMALVLAGLGWFMRSSNPSSTLPTSVPACTATTAERIQRADLILTGRVAMVLPAGEHQARVIVTPDRLYRGSMTEKSLVINAVAAEPVDNEVLSTGGLHFASSQLPYMFYLRRQADGSYTTSACDGTRLLGVGLTPEEQGILEPLGTT